MLSNLKENSFSWFSLMRHTCSQYSLPTPDALLKSPISPTSFKSLITGKVVDFWEQKLRDAASKSAFYSLCKPHPIWTTAGNNPYEVDKATVQARMLAGQYRTCWLSRHWSGDASGCCTLPACRLQNPTPGTLQHFLLECIDLKPARDRLLDLWDRTAKDTPLLSGLINKVWPCTADKDLALQFILDCSVLPDAMLSG